MGTRCLTRVIDEDGNILVTLYRQMDGYPDGHGSELADFLKPYKIINGISGCKSGKVANGAGCLAAQLVSHFKTDVGGFYLVPCKKDLNHDQEFEYDVVVNKSKITVNGYSMYGKRKLIFSMPPSGMDLAIKLYGESENNE